MKIYREIWRIIQLHRTVVSWYKISWNNSSINSLVPNNIIEMIYAKNMFDVTHGYYSFHSLNNSRVLHRTYFCTNCFGHIIGNQTTYRTISCNNDIRYVARSNFVDSLNGTNGCFTIFHVLKQGSPALHWLIQWVGQMVAAHQFEHNFA